jgi:glycosyltransferase involved in cell wall biosynthesis
MKIVIAAWHLRDFNVGLGRYCKGLIEGLGRVDRENQYEVLMPDVSCRFPDWPNMRYRVIRFPVFKRRFWEQVAPIMARPYDILHFPYDSCVAWKQGRFVTTIHDVKPLIFPELKSSRLNLNSVIEGMLVGNRWKMIDHIVTDSESSRRDILERLPVSPDCLTVVRPGIDLDRFRPAELRTNSRRPYVLSVAGTDPTKNVQTLLEAFIRLPPPVRNTHDFVLVGDIWRHQELRERAAGAGIEKQVLFPGVVDDAALIQFYQQAALFVFHSRYEGFGLPVLEAMACGCSVISSNVSSMPEVAGDAALLVDPLDVDGLARTMQRVLSDPGLAQDLRARGLARAVQFSWDRTAREMVAVYRKVRED